MVSPRHSSTSHIPRNFLIPKLSSSILLFLSFRPPFPLPFFPLHSFTRWRCPPESTHSDTLVHSTYTPRILGEGRKGGGEIVCLPTFRVANIQKRSSAEKLIFRIDGRQNCRDLLAGKRPVKIYSRAISTLRYVRGTVRGCVLLRFEKCFGKRVRALFLFNREL